jgi:hypothetical protein
MKKGNSVKYMFRTNEKTPTLIPRIGAHIRKAPSIENGGTKSVTGERAQKWASDRQARPLAEGDRQL